MVPECQGSCLTRPLVALCPLIWGCALRGVSTDTWLRSFYLEMEEVFSGSEFYSKKGRRHLCASLKRVRAIGSGVSEKPLPTACGLSVLSLMRPSPAQHGPESSCLTLLHSCGPFS